MYEPNEPHDEWGRPVKSTDKKESILDTTRDVFFYTVVGLLFLALFGWVLIVFLPYYFGRAIWERFESWYINRLKK